MVREILPLSKFNFSDADISFEDDVMGNLSSRFCNLLYLYPKSLLLPPYRNVCVEVSVRRGDLRKSDLKKDELGSYMKHHLSSLSFPFDCICAVRRCNASSVPSS